MPDPTTPGVYVEEVNFGAKSIEGVATSTAGFTGMTRWGPPGGVSRSGNARPVPLTSWSEFERSYGGLETLQLEGGEERVGYLAHAANAFFLNGGARLYVSRVFKPGASGDGVAKLTVPVGRGASATWHARCPGRFGNVRLKVAVRRSRNVAFEVKIGGEKLVQAKRAGRGAVVEIVPAAGVKRRGRGGPQAEWYAVAIGAGGKQTFYGRSGARFTPARGCRIRIITLDVAVASDTPHAESHRGLGLHPAHGRYIGRVLRRDDASGGSGLLWLEWDADAFGTSTRRLGGAVRLAAALGALADARLSGGSDGVLVDAEALRGTEADAGSGHAPTGLAALARLDDVAIVASPDASTLATSEASALAAQYLVAHAEAARYRIALVDAPPGSSVSDVRSFRARFDSSRAALHYPWVIVADPLDAAVGEAPRELALPPSGFIAGVYARNDAERGVYTAPANVALTGVLRPEVELGKPEQDVLNPEGINLLRSFEGRGLRVWGARTLSADPEWKYVSVRRLLIYLEHSIDRGTQWAVFEPNGEQLWASVRRVIEDFLRVQWQNGALQGSTPDAAYFVRCDRTTMTQNDLDNGRLVALIGVAPVRPAEFVIFRIGQWTAAADKGSCTPSMRPQDGPRARLHAPAASRSIERSEAESGAGARPRRLAGLAHRGWVGGRRRAFRQSRSGVRSWWVWVRGGPGGPPLQERHEQPSA